jgi:hypothetical protein
VYDFDITNITTDPALLFKCVLVWERAGYRGLPPDPSEVAMMSTAQNEVVSMANFIQFIRDEPKRLAASSGAMNLRDITSGTK